MKRKTDGLKERAVQTLFGESRGTKCDIPRLSRETGIAEATLRRYRRQPETISLERLSIIAKAMDRTPEEVGYVITGVRR